MKAAAALATYLTHNKHLLVERTYQERRGHSPSKAFALSMRYFRIYGRRGPCKCQVCDRVTGRSVKALFPN